VELSTSALPGSGSGVDEPISIAEAPKTKFEPELEIDTLDTQVQEPQLDISARALDVIDKLGKREARLLCSPLGIQQKCNGVELTTELMVASIRREFKTNPERVIEVICERLPELLSVPRQVDQKQAS
jgi:ribosomal protein L28